MSHGLAQFARSRECDAVVIVYLREARAGASRQCGVELMKCAFKIACGSERLGEVVMNACRSGHQPDRFAKLSNRIIPASGHLERQSEVVVHFGEIGLERERFSIFRDRVQWTSEPAVHVAHVLMQVRRIRIQGKRGLHMLRRFLIASELLQHFLDASGIDRGDPSVVLWTRLARAVTGCGSPREARLIG